VKWIFRNRYCFFKSRPAGVIRETSQSYIWYICSHSKVSHIKSQDHAVKVPMIWDNGGLFASCFIWGRIHDLVDVEFHSDRNIHVVTKYRNFILGHLSQSITFMHSLFRISVSFPRYNHFVKFFRSNWKYGDRKRGFFLKGFKDVKDR